MGKFWENFVSAGINSGGARGVSGLSGMELFACDCKMYIMGSSECCRDLGKAGQGFVPANRDHVIPLSQTKKVLSRSASRKATCIYKFDY